MSKYNQRTAKSAFYNRKNFSTTTTQSRGFDDTITQNSNKGITSGAVFTAMSGKQDTINPGGTITDRAVVFN